MRPVEIVWIPKGFSSNNEPYEINYYSKEHKKSPYPDNSLTEVSTKKVKKYKGK